jgi:hypothetical protein
MDFPFAKPIKDHEEARKILFQMGLSFHICYWLGFIFAILGLIASAMNAALGLEPIYWLLLAMAAFLAGIPMLVTWALAMHLLGIESKKEK